MPHGYGVQQPCINEDWLSAWAQVLGALWLDDRRVNGAILCAPWVIRFDPFCPSPALEFACARELARFAILHGGHACECYLAAYYEKIINARKGLAAPLEKVIGDR